MSFVLLVSAFSNINPGSNSRMKAIYSQIAGDKIVLTSDFNHRKKQYYSFEEMRHPDQQVLHVPSYNSNIGIKRIWSHIVFARQIKKYLLSLDEKPDVIYCSMPTSSSAYVCAKFCRKNGIKFVIDVIDLWPDSLLPLVKGKTLIKALLYPWTYLTRYAYRSADVIMGESVKYANEAKRYNPKAKIFPIYLGVDTNITNKIKENPTVRLQKPSGEIWIAYAGSLGVSYDFDNLLTAVKNIHGSYKYKLWFVGDGVRRNEIQSYITKYGLNAEITGFLDYEHLLGYLGYCDIAVNIFRDNTKVVYSYKFNDYVAMGCFVLNSLEGETADMVNEYQIGRNFNFSDLPLSMVLDDTIAHWEKYGTWRGNHQRLIDEKLNKEKIYSVVKDIFQT